ncbi:roadblock/LC7 domain-containing protein [Ramlibacter sp.]|uniref:roadblock/LC7 domain-containing protein n=1 Tax=Ramlibacter sp. TaxID=1917967 RepID=UPI0035B15E73
MQSEAFHAHVPPALRAAAQAQAEALLREVSGMRAVLAATADGFELAAALAAAVDTARLAALASSIAAIGEVVSAEAGMGDSRTVIVETAGGLVLVHRVPRSDVSCVLTALAGPDALLGQVKFQLAAAASALAQI